MKKADDTDFISTLIIRGIFASLFYIVIILFLFLEIIYSLFLDSINLDVLTYGVKDDRSNYYFSILCGFFCILISIVFYKKRKKACQFIIILAICFLYFPLSTLKTINSNTNKSIQRQARVFFYNSKDLFWYWCVYQHFPNRLEEAIELSWKRHSTDDIPKKCLNYRLADPFLGKTNIVPIFDGTGGWVYDPEKGIFGINVNEMEEYSTNFTEYIEMIKKDFTK